MNPSDSRGADRSPGTPSSSAPTPPPGDVAPPLDVTEAGAPPAGAPPASARPRARPPVHDERRKRMVGWQSRDIIRTAALVIALFYGLKLLWFANQLVLVTFLGVLFGLAVSSGVDRLNRFRIPRGIAAALVVVSFFGLLAGFGAWMAPTIREQGTVLRQRLPEAVDRIENWVNRQERGFLGAMLRSGPDTAPAQVQPAPPRPDAEAARTAQGAPPARSTVVVDTVSADPGAPSTAQSLKDRLGRQMGGATRYLFPFLSSTLAVIAGLFLIVFLSIYIATNPELYHRGLMHLFPRRSRERAGEVLSAMATVLRKWLVTQLIAMVAIGIVTTVGLLLLDVKAAFALGLLAGLLEFIPTVGPILSAVPAIAMGFLDSPEKAVSVMILYIVIQFVENHLLIPLLMQGGMDLPPALTILSQTLLALVFGFLGLMVAVPVLAAGMVAVKMLYVQDVVGDDVTVLEDDDD
jgi:predicted PurR-regulated permease PerM